jgi:hypothetical protein
MDMDAYLSAIVMFDFLGVFETTTRLFTTVRETSPTM